MTQYFVVARPEGSKIAWEWMVPASGPFKTLTEAEMDAMDKRFSGHETMVRAIEGKK